MNDDLASGSGITSYGVYVPRYRVERAAIQAMIGRAGGSGQRAVASFDEDALTMGVAAAVRARSAATREVPGSLWFATTRPPYLDKNNATVLASALGLPDTVGAFDSIGSERSGFGALCSALATDGLAVLSDLRYGRVGSSDSLQGADAATAIEFGPEPIAEVLAVASRNVELNDRYRVEGHAGATLWEERFASHFLAPLMEQVATDVLRRADVERSEVNHLVVSAGNDRAARTMRSAWAVPNSSVGHAVSVGYAGAADLGAALAAALDQASPGDVILAITASDGADAVLLRVTSRIEAYRARAAQHADGDLNIDPVLWLKWRGLLVEEPPRRPPQTMPAAPAAQRNAAWKYAFVGSVCQKCDTRHLPPQQVCMKCGEVGAMDQVAMAGARGRVTTFSVDHLANSLAREAIVAVVDFDGGGRYQCMLTDATAGEVQIGTPVEMTFRVLDVAPSGLRNYFWKARPIREEND